MIKQYSNEKIIFNNYMLLMVLTLPIVKNKKTGFKGSNYSLVVLENLNIEINDLFQRMIEMKLNKFVFIVVSEKYYFLKQRFRLNENDKKSPTLLLIKIGTKEFFNVEVLETIFLKSRQKNFEVFYGFNDKN